ncbi:MAG: HAMP domain-containing histidine kinase [Ruminococcaceae bacterium]|nr:HAMP domain-containing histidine kinase [Oscillospiraceae bacterium]
MRLDIKFKSITYKWFFNIFLVVALAVCVAAVAFSSLYSSLYNEKIEALALDYSDEFSALVNTDRKTFADTAISIADKFKYKDKIEVQVIDKNGKLVVSTTGFWADVGEMPDYLKAKETKTFQTYKGKSSTKEPIMAGTTMIYTQKGEELGAYRWVTSMSLANKIMGYITAIVVLICVVILAVTAITGIFFVKSIVNPIRDVSNIARTIAMGNFDSRIEIKKDDEIGELCDAINYMASELSNSENIKNDFISSVSHELRTPLTAIRGWGETAKMSLGTDEELVQRGLDVVLSEADRLSGLVEELLDFSRMQTGRLSLVSQPMDITLLLKESVDMYVELAKQQNIDLAFAIPNDEIVVLGDKNRLKQVFINVIDNAVKYTNAGGQVLVNFDTEEACVRITVKDTGVGIPAEDIDRVKEKFYKANKTVRGSGIGLAVADEIIKQHDGLLFIESIENVGTTVTVVLPIYEEAVEEQPQEQQELPQPQETQIESEQNDG